MKRIAVVSILALVVLATANKTRAQSAESSAEKKIEAIFSSVTSPDEPGLAVLVRKNGANVFERGYGVRDLRSKTKIDAWTNFRLASFTKQLPRWLSCCLCATGKSATRKRSRKSFPIFQRTENRLPFEIF